MISRNIEKEFTKIVDEYLIEVYRNTLEIPTVSEGKFLNGNYQNEKRGENLNARKNNQTIIKILIGVIIILSTIILLSGIFYILNMQKKIIKLETEQEEQLKRQVETQNMASIQSVQSQLNTKKRSRSKNRAKSS